MLVKILPKVSASSFMGYLKEKSTLIIFEWHVNLKYKYGKRHRGFYVSTAKSNKEATKRYIRYQQEEDMMTARMLAKEYLNFFKGQPV